MAAISQTTFSNAFSCMKMFGIRFRFHWIWVTRVQLTILQHWFIWWLGVGQATSHYLNQRWSALLTHVCVTRPQWPERHIVHTNTLIYVFVNNKSLTSEQNMVRGCKCLWNLSDHNIPNCMKEVTWLKLWLSTSGHRSAALEWLPFILPPVFVQAVVIRSW